MKRGARTAAGACIAAALALPATAAAAPSVSEFASGLSSGAQIHRVVAGPDGNLWMTDNANGKVDTVTPSGAITEHSGLGGGSAPEGIVAGPDGALWFVGSGTSNVGRMTTAGTLTNTYSLTGSSPQAIVTGPDGALWFTESGSPAKIGRLTTTGTLTEFALPTASSAPWGIAVGSDGLVWFTEHTNPGKVGKIDPVSHTITEYSLGAGLPYDVAAGADGAIWVTLGSNPGKIARITTDGSVLQTWSVPTANSTPLGLTAGPDGYLYFTEKTGNGAVGRISTSGTIQEFAAGTTTGFTTALNPWGIAFGSDGNAWFAESAQGIARLSIEPVVVAAAATGVSATEATIHASVRPSSQATSVYFQIGATTGYGTQSNTGSAGAGAGPVAVWATIGQLAPLTTYHYRLVATNASGTRYGPDVTFTTPAAADDSGNAGERGDGQPSGATTQAGGSAPSSGTPTPAPTPVIGKTVAVGTASGTISVRRPGEASFTTLGAAEAIPVGSTIDATHGAVALTTIRDSSGKLQTGTFWGGAFQVTQQRSGMTSLRLRGGDFRSCARPAQRRRLAAAGAPRTVRRLFGRDNHGRFRTYGSRSIATVRGTQWITTDRCDGTLTRVLAGRVSVTDLTSRHTVMVSAGQSYLARRPK